MLHLLQNFFLIFLFFGQPLLQIHHQRGNVLPGWRTRHSALQQRTNIGSLVKMASLVLRSPCGELKFQNHHRRLLFFLEQHIPFTVCHDSVFQNKKKLKILWIFPEIWPTMWINWWDKNIAFQKTRCDGVEGSEELWAGGSSCVPSKQVCQEQ